VRSASTCPLRRLPRLLEASLFALDDPQVPSEEALSLERDPQLGVGPDERTDDAGRSHGRVASITSDVAISVHSIRRSSAEARVFARARLASSNIKEPCSGELRRKRSEIMKVAPFMAGRAEGHAKQVDVVLDGIAVAAMTLQSASCTTQVRDSRRKPMPSSGQSGAW
jgi:hypothetical protein